MPAKEMLFDNAARSRIADGLNALANAVKVTLGPRGRNVVLDKAYGPPIITKDGVSVAKEIELENHFANMGAQMVREVASKTADVAGDGTTTATLLAQAIYVEGAKLVTAGVNPMEIKRGIDRAVDAVVGDLKKQSRPVEGKSEIAQVGIISSNGDTTIGNLLAEAMEKVGKEGVITLEEAKTMETTLEIVDGMQFERGYLSPYFVTDAARMKVTLEDAYILTHEKRISNMRDLLPLLELVAGSGKPLLIIAEDIEGEALATLVVNKLRGTLQVCAVKAPGFGERRTEMMHDVAILAGGQLVAENLGIELSSLTLKDLGHAKSILIDKDTTTVIGGAGTKEQVQARAKQIRMQLETTTSDYDREKLQARLAKIAAGVAVLKIGAATETEMKEKKARVEDALSATRAAVEEGIVPGGGVALLRALPALEALVVDGDQRYGVDIIKRALEAPLRQMVENGGNEGAVVVNEVRAGKGAFGFNVATNKYEDLGVAGVIDPTKVVRVALQNAASVASLMLTMGVMIGQATPSASQET